MSSPSQWYLAQLKPNGFQRAVINLERQNIGTFMPLQNTNVKHGHRQTQKKQPLFPGYIFIELDTSNSKWSTVNNTYGVSKIISFGNQHPKPLPDEFILGLKARCASDNVLLPPNDLKIGEKIKIISGPFTDYIATIETIPSQARLGILLDLLGQKTPTQINLENVERIYD